MGRRKGVRGVKDELQIERLERIAGYVPNTLLRASEED